VLKSPRFKFSHTLKGKIWSTLAIADSNLLVVEVRDDQNFQVEFSVLDYSENAWTFEKLRLSEQWWAGITAAGGSTILFHTFRSKDNPDHKNLIAYDIFKRKIRWEVEEFSFFDWDDSTIWGHKTGTDLLQATISIESGVVTEMKWGDKHGLKAMEIAKPLRYLEGMQHFETVQRFVEQRSTYLPVKGIEYLEWREWIMIGIYVEEGGKLANYLLVFNSNGELSMEEKLDENLVGLGADTFFILSGCLFLIKNRSELAVYSYD
jgi:hypothetical protein